jgi:hypothetical protein
MSDSSLEPRRPTDLPSQSGDSDMSEQFRLFNETRLRELDLERQELEIRREENATERAKIESSSQYATDSLRYQAQFWERGQGNAQQRFKWRLVVGFLTLLTLIGVTFGLIAVGQPEFAKEILKYVGTFVAGGLGGYGIGTRRGKQGGEKHDGEGG